ncbi:MAG: hypothetical protein NDF57_04140 [archaeon GBS-70-058]|nr:hypothetical protein [Candidatus Culexarchaeum nevadense]
MSFPFFAASSGYSALKRVFPRNIKTWLLVHCVTGVLSLVLVVFYMINKIQAPRPVHFIDFFAFLVMAVVVVSGTLGRYVKTKFIRKYWRTIHTSLTIIVYFTSAFHILEKNEFFMVAKANQTLNGIT